MIVSAASRQRRERERIRAIATAIPPGCGLEFDACRGAYRIVIVRVIRDRTIHHNKQFLPICPAGQVPAFGAKTLNRVCRRTCLAIPASRAVTPYARSVHCRSPRVKPTVLGAIAGIVFVAVTTVLRFVVEVLGHPYLRTDGHRLVGMAVAGIRQGFVFNEA